MTPETAGLTFAEIVLRAGPTLAAVGIWVFGAFMVFQNWRKERKADAAQAQAVEDRKAALADAAEARKVTQGMLADAAEDRKVTQAMLAALTELVRRTSPPSSQAGPQPSPAE